MPPERTTRKAPTAWTPEEEAIWNEIAIKCLRQHMPAMVRTDGRLEERNNSIKSHLNAMINNVFKKK